MKDAMAGFELYQPTDLDAAVELGARWGERGWILAGGYDSLDWFKDRVKVPEAVIDLANVAELHGIREADGGLEIGAMTTLTEVSRHPLVREHFRLLADAAAEVASPQIRNAGTLGGNLCQDTRCWYYRYGVDCYRAGGNTCYAAAPDAQNREHAIFGASRCVAVSPSDTAPALVALDAEMVVRSPGGERVIPAEDFFMEPAVDIERMTVLEPGDVLTTIRIPDTWAGATFYFEKVADRNSWDFALASVAAAFRTDGVTIQDARIVCGAVQCVPRRMRAVERQLRG
ncbi:MAG: FAD binding domain-containing protein, partial [Longimicrobiales bacterium]|nr:FAD binding domain-containing protein [Longimicrobiales bacterium]